MKINVLCLFILLLIGCDKKDTNTYTGPPVPFLKTKWILSSLQNTTTSVIINYPVNIPSEYILFGDSLNILSIKGCCNVYDFPFSIGRNDSVSITGNGISTLIACENMQWETYLVNSIGNMYQYKKNENNLIIYSKGTFNSNFVAQ